MKNLNIFTALSIFLVCSSSYSQTGTLDPSFGSGGIVTTSYPDDNDGESVAIQNDGKIVLVGTTYDPSGNAAMRVNRYLDDGSIDNTFGVNGTVSLAGPLSQGTAVVIQPNGKIIAVGTIDGGANNYDILVIRLNTDGTYDNSFGTAGVVSFHATAAELGQGVALQTDGKIVITGIFSGPSGTDAIAVRLNTDGVADTSFGGGTGYKTIDAGGDDYAEAVLIQGDGKIIVIGTNYSSPLGDILVARLNTDGTEDTSFGSNGNGLVITDVVLGDNDGSSGALQADGKILVVGTAEVNIGPTSNIEFCTVRYNTDGTLDTSFGGGGIVTGDLDGGEDTGTSIAVQSDGGIIVAGDGEVGGTTQIGMLRYHADGSLDSTFGTNGVITTAIGSNEDLCNAMVLQPDNGQYILLAGESDDAMGDSDFALVRYQNTVGFSTLNRVEIPLTVYPNPLSNQSVIEYSLRKEETVSIKLCSLAGELVQTILEETTQQQGEHQQLLEINNNLSKGSYLLKVETLSSSTSIEIHL